MAQTTEIAPGIRNFYKKYFGGLGLNRSVHALIGFLVDLYASALGFSFPAKFNWEWKLEMLTNKYEAETLSLFKKIITPGMVVIDIGAHIGFFSRIFSSLVGNSGIVHCFEADLDNFALLHKNTQGRGNVRLHKVAVSDHVGNIDFYHLDNSTGCHSVVDPGSASTKITVDATTLDTLIETGVISEVELIKIDIEGGEPFAFKGMEKLLKNTPDIKLVTEFNEKSLADGGTTAKAFFDQIRSYGFKISFITNNGTVPIDTIPASERSRYYSRTGYVNLYCEK